MPPSTDNRLTAFCTWRRLTRRPWTAISAPAGGRARGSCAPARLWAPWRPCSRGSASSQWPPTAPHLQRPGVSAPIMAGLVRSGALTELSSSRSTRIGRDHSSAYRPITNSRSRWPRCPSGLGWTIRKPEGRRNPHCMKGQLCGTPVRRPQSLSVPGAVRPSRFPICCTPGDKWDVDCILACGK